MTREEVLTEIAEIAGRFDWEVGNYEDHGDDCPAHDEDKFQYQEHAKDCEASPGLRIDLVEKEGCAWLVWPDVECCAPEYMRDEAAMIDACDCTTGAFHRINVLARAALLAVLPASVEEGKP